MRPEFPLLEILLPLRVETWSRALITTSPAQPKPSLEPELVVLTVDWFRETDPCVASSWIKGKLSGSAIAFLLVLEILLLLAIKSCSLARIVIFPATPEPKLFVST